MAYVGAYLALTVALFLLFYLTGHAATRALAPLPPGARREDRAAHYLVAGVAAWATLLFALAALQRLRPAPIAAVIAAAAVWGIASVWSARARGTGEAATAEPRRAGGWRDPFALLLIAVVAVVIAGLWAQTLRPIVAWDADVYHLTVPRLYLEHGGFYRIPFNVYSNWPLAVQLLFALAMVIKDYVLATAVHFGFGVLLVAVVGLATARASTPLWGAIAAALLLLHPVFLFEIRVAYIDVACAFFLFAAFLALHRALEDPASERRWLVLSGVACGVLAAAKLNGIFGAACIAAVYVGSKLRRGASAAEVARSLFALGAPIAALSLPWMVKSLVLTGNPVYPLLYDLFGGPEWSDQLGRAHRSWQRAIGMGRSPLDLVLLPFRVLFLGGEGYHRFDGRLHPLAGILLPAALIAARRDAPVRRALAVASVWFVLWGATSQQMRFLIPALPLLAMATALGLRTLAARWPRSRAVLARGLALIVAALLVQANLHYLEQAPRLYAALWTRGDALRAHATDEVFPEIDRRLPADAKVLFVNVNRGFFCRREFLADSFFEASQTVAMLRDLIGRGDLRGGLRDLGVTHVLVENESRRLDYPKEFVDLVESPENRTVYRSPDGRFRLIALAG